MCSLMFKIRRDDIVMVMKGKDRGKTGKVLAVIVEKRKALVEGVNFVKKAMRRRREDEQAGIIQREAPISLANLALVCKHCNQPTRVGFSVIADGSKLRVCKKCKETF